MLHKPKKAAVGPLGRAERPMILTFLIPLLAVYGLFFIYPAIRALYISLFDWNGFTSDMKFVGLDNFKELFGDSSFWSVAVANSARILFIGGLLVFLIAFIISGLLTTKIRGKKIMRAIIFFPTIISPVAVSILWSSIFNSNWGLLNGILEALHLESLIQVWTEPGKLQWVIIVVLAWVYSGFYCVILLAALDRIPQSHIEAAKLAGANELQIFIKIKLPMIKDVLATAMTLWCIDAIKQFGILYAWGGGTTIPSADVTNLAVKMYMTAFGRRITIYRMGYATAMGVIMFVFVALVVGLISKLMKSDPFEY